MSDHSIIVRPISTSAVYAVRHPVLRHSKTIESCIFEGDELNTTMHFGIFSANELAGVASLFLKKSDLFSETHQFQLRGMAILQEFQNRGFGKLLLDYAEGFARDKSTELLWFNARILAVPFYKSCGYDSVGNAFNIGDIGEHYVMFKKLMQ